MKVVVLVERLGASIGAEFETSCKPMAVRGKINNNGRIKFTCNPIMYLSL